MSIDSRFEPLFHRMLTRDPTTGVYSGSSQLVEETVTAREARSRVECVVMCRGDSDCTGANYIREDSSCEMMRFQPGLLP